MDGCEKCGRLDSTLRASTFTYVISVILMTSRRGAGGIFCSSCRKKEALKYSLLSGVFGWWGFPWGPVYTLQAIGRNSAGGLQEKGLNADVLQAVAAELIDRGDKSAAIDALEESLRLSDDGDARHVLWSLKGEAASAPASLAAESAPLPLGPSVASRYTPGALVRTAAGRTPLYAQPEAVGEAVATLDSETAVVTRAHAGWLEVQVPGGSSGWIAESAIQSA